MRAQLQHTAEKLGRATNNFASLLASTDIAAVFLDRALRVHWFTPSMIRVLDLVPADVGRSFAQVARKFPAWNLVEEAEDVLTTLDARHDEVEAPDKRWYMRRILPYRMDDGRVEGVVIAFTDISRRHAAENRQKILVSELRHRVRNVLATARSLAAESGRMTLSEGDLARFLEAFDARINALARVQTLIIEDDIDRIDLEDLVREELFAHAEQEGEGFTISGPPVALTSQAGQMIALATAELATNAVKFGAFSQRQGRVEVKWKVLGHGERRRLRITWTESNVKKVQRGARKGFGMELVETGLPYTLGGASTVTFRRCGIRCVIEIPVKENVVGL